MKTARVKDRDGTIHSVRAYDEFAHVIRGQEFQFVITRSLLGGDFSVTHKASGLRVCVVPEGIRDKTNATQVERALDCVSRLIDRLGAERVHSILTSAPLLPPLKWVAGWNMPGYMPEEPFAEFDTFEEARDYVVDELERVADGIMGDAESVEDAEELTRVNGAIAWVKRQRDEFTISPVQGYAYEVTRQK